MTPTSSQLISPNRSLPAASLGVVPALCGPMGARTKSPARDYAGEFAATVELVLRFAAPAPGLTAVHKTYFKDVLGLSTLKELYAGHPVSRKVIQGLINAPAIAKNPVNCAEICIRWGELVLEEDVYHRYTEDCDNWNQAYMANPADAYALAWPKPATSWSTYVRHYLHWNSAPLKLGRKRLSIRHVAQLLKKSESGLYKALLTGGLKIKTFKAFRKLLPITEKEKRYLTQLYVEHQVGRSLLNFSQHDFVKHYCLGTHHRLLPWIIGNSRV